MDKQPGITSESEWQRLHQEYKHLWYEYFWPIDDMTLFVDGLSKRKDNGQALREFLAWLDGIDKPTANQPTTKQNLIRMGITAVVTMISATLPGYLYLRGLPMGWALALLGGYVAVAILGYLGHGA